MKRLIWTAMSLVLAAGLVHAADKQGEKIKMINGKYVIDVRGTDEWNEDHLNGAIHIPVDEIGTTIVTVITDKKAPIALYCRSGHRAGIALKKLKELGYENAENLGGLSDARKKFEKK